MKSGFVSVIGRTNAGKSSLINALSERKLALISPKQNATRRKIRAIIMFEGAQIIFTDTPGLHQSEKKFNQMLVNSALQSASECDLVLFVASVLDSTSEYERFLQNALKAPHIVLLNKVDLVKNEQVLQKLAEYAKFSANFTALVPFSCKQKSYKKPLLDEITKHLPENPYFFEPEFLSDTSERELFRDFILEALFENFSDELPYACEVLVESVSETPTTTHINATIITDNAHHKAILIGKNGKSLARVGFEARKKIENFTGKKIVLKTFIQVKKGWQNDDDFLKKVVF